MTDDRDLDEALRAMRAAFDAHFARSPEDRRRDEVALLAIRAGADAVALRVLDTAGLLPARPIVPVPSRRAELLGVVGLRGAVVPVYALARLLGRAEGPDAPRWFALVGAAGDRVALAFDDFEGHVLVPATELHPPRSDERVRHVAALARLPGGARPVLRVDSIVASLGRRATEDGR